MYRGLKFCIKDGVGELLPVRRSTRVLSLVRGRRYLLVPPSKVAPRVWVTGEFVDVVGGSLRFTGLNGDGGTILRLARDGDGLYPFPAKDILSSDKFLLTDL